MFPHYASGTTGSCLAGAYRTAAELCPGFRQVSCCFSDSVYTTGALIMRIGLWGIIDHSYDTDAKLKNGHDDLRHRW